MRVSPSFEGKEFVYQTGPLSYRSDFYNELFLNPADIFTEQTRRWIAAADLFGHVVDANSNLDATHYLEGAVNALYGDYSDRSSPKAVLEMQFLLVKDTGAEPRVILQRNYREVTPLKDDLPETLVEGWRQGLMKILAAFEADLRKADLK